MAQTTARFLAKLYDKTGATFKRVLDANILTELPRISREVSKPASEIVLSLALPWDDFDFGTTISDFFLVKLYAINDNHPDGILVYQGFITEIHSILAIGSDHVELRVFPLESLLDFAFWKSGSGQTLGDYTKSYSGADVDTIMGDAITDANTVHGTAYFTSSLGNPGVSITADLVELTHLAGINKALGFLDATWYWRVRADGTFELRQWSDATADHRFTLGQDVDMIDSTRSLIDIKNGIRVEYTGPAYSFYNDATSEGSYAKRQEKQSDTSILNLTSADAFGNGLVAKKKDPKTKTKLTVNAQYDLETIKPGDTCRVLNVSNSNPMLSSATIYRIIRVEYDGATAQLHLSDIVDNFGVEFGKAIS